MLGIHDLWLFIAAGLVLNVTPGPDTAYIVGRSAQFGWRGGAVAALGIGAGCFVHVFGCAVGLSALIATSATAFAIVKWLGAAYLCVVGAKMLLSRATSSTGTGSSLQERMGLSKVFWQGALTNALNPKVALFFLAFLPQFVATDAPHKAFAFIALGAIFIVNGTLWCLGVAVLSARAAGRFKQSRRSSRWINRALGIMFVGLGLRMAMLQTR